MTLAQHSAATPEHYTPLEYIEAAREVMGVIDLDPATTHRVNAERVKAVAYFDQELNGLENEWNGNVFLNPPGGRVGRKSSAAVWWDKLVEEYLADRVRQAIFLGFSIEIMATSQDSKMWAGQFPFCIPRNRIEFVNEQFEKGTSPTHSNVVVYLPPRRCNIERVEQFENSFSQFGKVAIPYE